MSILRTDYKDDVINENLAADRKFGEVENEDGTKSFNDLTPYTQQGDEYGASEVNFENKHTNYAIEAADHTYKGVDLTVEFAKEIAGYPNVWRWIKARIAAANFDGIHVGDYIDMYMGAYLMRMQVAGIDTYYRTGDTGFEIGHHIDFISKDCYPDPTKWFTADDNNGLSGNMAPYNKSTVKSFLAGLESKLPAELREVISDKRSILEQRYSSTGKIENNTAWGWANLGRLWIPSEYEVFGSCIWSAPKWGAGQAAQYPIFANSWQNRVKGIGNGGERCYWWLLSVSGGSTTNACYVGYHGIAVYSGTSSSQRVPICFRIME